MIGTIDHNIIETETRARVHNTQIPGIGRLEHVLGLIAISNLSRNILFCTPELTTKAVYSETVFADLDKQSQFDLDIHAFVAVDGKIAAPNHYGLIRFFDVPALQHLDQWVTTSAMAHWPGDVERFTTAHGCLLSSSPLGYSVSTKAQAGLLISTDVGRHLKAHAAHSEPAELPYHIHLQSWGFTSAIVVNEKARQIAVAAGGRVGIFPYKIKASGELDLLDPVIEFNSGFHTSALAFLDNGELFAAGHAPTKEELNPLDWDEIGGGGWCLIGPDGHIIQHQFGKDLAWGNGGDPVQYHAASQSVFGVDKLGGIHCWNARSGGYRLLFEPFFETTRGIAHATMIGNRLLCGFNRDGYRVHEFTI